MNIGYGLLLFTCLCGFPAQAQPPVVPPDSVLTEAPPARPALLQTLTRPVVLRAALPLALIGGGYWGREQRLIREMRMEVREETLEAFPNFRTRLDDYTRHVPAAAAYVLHLAGVRPARGVVPFSLIYLAAHHLNAGLTSNLKRLAHEARPDNPADFSSFPSSHTSEAFMTATLLHEQFGQASPWISVGGYAVATGTGALRVLQNKHWITDVAAGAGVGFLAAEMVWRAYPYAARLLPPKLAQKLLLLPAYAPGGAVGLVVVLRP